MHHRINGAAAYAGGTLAIVPVVVIVPMMAVVSVVAVMGLRDEACRAAMDTGLILSALTWPAP